MKKHVSIKWKSLEVLVKDILPTPNNYKIKTDLGRERLQQSLEMFGLAGNVIVNPSKRKGKFDLIDGNSRIEQAKERGEKKVWVSIPNRTLTPKEYTEMAAMYDYAKVGEVDIERIKGELGKTEDFFKKWGLEVPMKVLDTMGSRSLKSNISEHSGRGEGKTNGKKVSTEEADVFKIELFFTQKQEREFRKMEDKFSAKFKTPSTSETVFKVFKTFCK